MGATEETGKAVTSFFDIMRGQPLSLALVISNFVLLIYMFYTGHEVLAQRRVLAELLIKQQSEVMQLLARCVVIDP